MKINDLQHKSIQKIYKQQQQQHIKEGKQIRADKMDISGKAKEIKELEQKLQQLPDIRKEKIETIKKKLAQGNYQIDAEAVARKILGYEVEQE